MQQDTIPLKNVFFILNFSYFKFKQVQGSIGVVICKTGVEMLLMLKC